ncbi:SAM-dependent methyltransferase [Lentzea tibetensis]|uniref:S-adenosyl-L-methionine-dependent methyltransferase n=1 Tax=Lentzea tibetensis TaxID=2591470 RepID=A0A563EWS7_9PSEU|nr:SAM-dependent methyltransferase [Lentzea tibetensis]TWP52022.1 SAM-dependent methyltransferase [Lentzea tibetensis]
MLTGVSKTALGVATVRARESERPDRLFDDPLAQRFLDAAPGAFPAQGPASGLGAIFHHHAVLRTRFFDEYLRATSNPQVVLLAAGLDTRAFRLDWRGVTLYELDLPELHAFKNAVLATETPRCDRRPVPTDLRTDWARDLEAAGFDRTAPTAWLAEGLLVYLDATEATNLLSTVHELSAAESTIAFERGIASEDLLRTTRDMPRLREYTALWKGGTDTRQWLTEHGWTTRAHDGRELAERWGRAVPDGAAGGFVTATNGEGAASARRRPPGPKTPSPQ